MFPPNETDIRQIHNAVFGSFDGGYTGPVLDAYLEHYNDVVRPYAQTSNDAVISVGNSVLQTHSDLLQCVKVLQKSTASTFDDFIADCRVLQRVSERKEKEYIVNTLINVLFMVDCGLRDYYSNKFQKSNLGFAKWEGAIRFYEFLKEILQDQGIGPSDILSQPTQGVDAVKNKKALKAWKLISRYDIEIKPTNNLLEHLSYNPSIRCLKVFHQVSFLKAQLQRTRDETLTLGFEQSLQK